MLKIHALKPDVFLLFIIQFHVNLDRLGSFLSNQRKTGLCMCMYVFVYTHTHTYRQRDRNRRIES